LELPAKLRRGPAESSDKPKLYDVLKWAEEEFHACLLTSSVAERARSYLKERGFTQATISRCKFGYSPDDWEWLLRRSRGHFDADLLYRARLIKERDEGNSRNGYRDKFADRVLFPIHDERGNTVGFGGRILPDSRRGDAVKYLNSDDSAVFHKSRLCYGLNWAREAIKKTQTVLVMEGYTDCIKAHQAGLLNVVATLGTALTEMHVTALKRLARTVVLVYDGDDPGQKAAERALLKFLAQDVDLRVLTLPDGLDPDEFLSERGTTAMERLVETAPDVAEYELRLLINRYGVETLDARLRVLDGMLGLLAVSDGVAGTEKEKLLVSRLPSRLRLPEEDVRKRLAELRGQRKKTSSRPVERKVSANGPSGEAAQSTRRRLILSLQQTQFKDDLLESELLQLLFTSPGMIEIVRREIGIDDIKHEVLKELLHICFDLADEGILPSFDKVLSHVECPELKGLIVWLDEQARERNLANQLVQDAAQIGKDQPEGLVRLVLDKLKWRRTRELHQAAQASLIERPQDTRKYTDETREMLLKAAEFHRRRAGGKDNVS
jgi:DNA primase